MKRRTLFDGREKTFYEGPEPDTMVISFKDVITAYMDGKRQETSLSGKGALCNRISAYLLERLDKIGVHSHFIRRLNMREQQVWTLEMIPIEIKVRNAAAGSFARRFNIEEGTQLPRPIVEMFLKNQELGNPMVTEEHITAFKLAAYEDLDDMITMALRVNDHLSGLFLGTGIRLIDIRLQFGWLAEEDMDIIVLADEISPDTCRLWDAQSGAKLDRDRFRDHADAVLDGYQEVARRLGIVQANLVAIGKSGKKQA